MSNIADFEYDLLPLSEGVICVARAIRPDFPDELVRRQLAGLTEQARAHIPADLHQDKQLTLLLELFYHSWGFGGVGGVYRLSDALWLDNVLERRQGLPASLGIILVHIAQALDIPLMPVIFPTQMILRADWLDGDRWLINPINGDTLDEHTLDIWLRGNLGIGTFLQDDDLEQADNNTVVRKLLDTLKTALMDEKQMELALNASEALLEFDPEDPYEIRDRGLIFAQLECDHVALSDLNYFVEQCPEDPISEMIKVQIHSIEQKLVTLH
ncbi:invasion regulator SirB1 [Biostraticola tofi]|uniref:Regulator of sirC expression with transglutaminase-like and TPR domain n=1 Tax=Biostraticola tofi TaxID=466109 RepID=A0A4R3Z1Q9_9GAMM|nr:invasion regulator SirB1 [Biostraticola tofi]TCV99693.1 regulator of sirC expression with transglutaminase-like and TPR domain [Biostraticola tofi]